NESNTTCPPPLPSRHSLAAAQGGLPPSTCPSPPLSLARAPQAKRHKAPQDLQETPRPPGTPKPPQSTPRPTPAPSPTSSPNSMVLAKPQPFNGTCGAAAESFAGQILLHTITYPEQFPTNSIKMAFAVSFMTDYAETWSQPYLMKSSFFDHNCQHCAEVALQFLRQTGTRPAYMQDLYQHGLKENIQLAVVISNIDFTSLWTMQAMALKAGQTIEGIWNGRPAPIPPASSNAPNTDPNAMDLSAFLSRGELQAQLQTKCCFK
ncbi:uncharacterized protein VP01_7159g2, partial [Puccinia sorghi]